MTGELEFTPQPEKTENSGETQQSAPRVMSEPAPDVQSPENGEE